MVTSTIRKHRVSTSINGCGRKMSNGFEIFTTDRLEAAGYPSAVNSCVRSLAKLFAVGSRVLSAIRTLAIAPGSASCCVYTTDARASAPFATSQLLVDFDRPVG